MTGLLPNTDEKSEESEEKVAISQTIESKTTKILTPDQLWERTNDHKHIDYDGKAVSQSSATDVVPLELLKMEENMKADKSWNNASVDEFDIPPIDPQHPDYEPSYDQPPVEPELEVVSEELRALESQAHQTTSDTDATIPMIGDPEDHLKPNELPPEPAEMEVEPESLQIE